MSEIDKRIGKRIQEVRDQKHLTQAQLGEKLGVSHVSVHRWEVGARVPSAYRMEEIARALDVEPGELYPKEEAPLRGPSPRAEVNETGLADALVGRIQATIGDRWLRWSQETPAASGREVLEVAADLKHLLETPGLREASAAGRYSLAMHLVKKLEDIGIRLESTDAEERIRAREEMEEFARTGAG